MSCEEETWEEFWMGLLVGAGLAILTMIMTYAITRDIWRQEVVKHGAAVWATTERGSVEWRWKAEREAGK